MTDRYRLHWFPDNASLVIRLALEHLSLPYDTVLVDRRVRAHKAADYLRINPTGLIPALETPDGALFETAAILLWLADRHGAMAPGPGDAERGAFLKHLFFTSNTLHIAARMRFYPDQFVGTHNAAQTHLRAHLASEIQRHLDILNAAYGAKASWMGAADLSVLDVYLACICRWIALYPKDEVKAWCKITRWPFLHDMMARLETCDCTQAAILAEGLGPHPFTKPDYPLMQQSSLP